jgi:hypothetical protein
MHPDHRKGQIDPLSNTICQCLTIDLVDGILEDIVTEDTHGDIGDITNALQNAWVT